MRLKLNSTFGKRKHFTLSFCIVIVMSWLLFASPQASAFNISVLNKFESNTDTVQVNELIAKAQQKISNIQADSAIYYAQNAYQIAAAIDFQQGLGFSQLVIARAYKQKTDFANALTFYLKSLNEFNEIEDATLIADINYEIGEMYFIWEVYEKSMGYFRLAKYSQKNNEHKYIKVQEAIASTHLKLNNPDSATYYYSQVLEYYYAKSELQSVIYVLEILADINKIRGYYENAINTKLIVLNHHKTLGNEQGEFATLNNLGFLYKQANNTNKSLEFFEKALLKSSSHQLKSSVLLNIGVIYINLGDYENALEHIYEALEINQSNKKLLATAEVYNMLASTYYLMQDYETAINYGSMAIEIGDKIKDFSLLTQSYLIVSDIYVSEGNFEAALEYYKLYAVAKNNVKEEDKNREIEALARNYVAEKTEKEQKLYFAEEEIKDLALKQLLLEREKREKELAFEKENNLLLQNKYELEKSAAEQRLQLVKQKLEAHKKDKQISQLNNEKKIKDYELKQREIEQKEQKREIQLLESNNKLLEQEKQLDALKAEKAKVLRNILIAAFCIALFVLLLILFNYFRKLKINRLLRLKNEEINQQKTSIEEQAKELHKMNEHLVKLDSFKDAMTGMIVHDLKNPLNTIINTSHANNIKGIANRMLLMVLNILDVQKFEDAALDLNMEPVSLQELFDNAVQQVITLAKEKNISIENSLVNDYTVSVDKDIVERVLENLLTNAVKYSPVNKKITINAEICEKQMVRISVKDLGAGVPEDKKHLIFEKFGQVDAKKLGITRSTGLGLTFCKMAVEAHGGEIGVESEQGKGSMFWFTIKGDETSKEITTKFEKIESDEKVQLTKSSYKQLEPFIEQFKNIKYYQITELRKVLADIDDSNGDIKLWKNMLTNAISSGNKLLYFELINIGSNEE